MTSTNVDLSANVPLDAFLRRISRLLDRAFREDGEITSAWFVVTDGGEAYMIGTPFYSTDDDPRAVGAKNRIVAWMCQHFKERNVVRYAHVAEAFKAPDDTCRPSLHEQREEIVVIQAQDYDGEIAGIRSIVRPEGGKPYLGQLKIMRDIGIGRFSGLLPPRVQH